MFVIIDDFSRFTWVIFLSSKGTVFKEFDIFIKKTQVSLGTKLKSIGSDHGIEFENSEFLNFCNQNGVFHNFSAPRTPQQNGVVERKNRTLENMVRTMMIESQVPPSFWAEAIFTVVYILKRAMIRPLLMKTPYELIKGRKPNISHLRVFGCRCFIHNNGKDALGKFDPRSDEGIFTGYSLQSKA